MQFVSPIPFSEAVSKLTSRQIVASGLDTEGWRRVPAALRDTAFFSSKIQDARFLQDVKSLLQDFLTSARETLPDGRTRLKVGSRAAFVEQARSFAHARGLGPLDPKDKGTLKDITSERRLSLIFKIQTDSANAYGDWLQGMQPAVLNAYPAWEFYRAEEVKTPRYLHQLNEGRIELKTNLDFWLAMNAPRLGGFDVPWGPWGFNSGMWTRDVRRQRAEELGLIGPSETLQPAHRDLSDRMAAGIATLDDSTRAWLKGQLGDQVAFDGAIARWTGQIPPVPKHPAPLRGEPAATPQPKPDQAPAVPKPQLLPADRKTAETRRDEALQLAGIDPDRPPTADQLAALLNLMRKPDALPVDTFIGHISTDDARLTQKWVRRTVGQFTDLLSPAVAKLLPSLQIKLGNISSLGSYLQGNLSLRKGRPGDEARETLWHELTHWLHIEGLQWWKDAIADHWDKRTQGESITRLPGYGSPGKLDKWYEAYAGKIYPQSPGYGAALNQISERGLEVPTRYFQVFAKPLWEQERLWRDPVFRETMMIVLLPFFA